MQSEFADRFGRRWRVELEQLSAPTISPDALASAPAPVSPPAPDLPRPGLSFVLFSEDGVALWSMWVPCRSIQAASDAAEDLDYLDRVVEELYYTSAAGASSAAS